MNKNNYYINEFLPKLDIGLYYEKLAQKQIIKYYKNEYYVKNTCNNNEYDFELSNDVKYEIKADIKSVLTSNIFIEFIQFNKPSGIEVSQAHFYVIIIPFEISIYILIEVKKLKELILNTKFKFVIYPTMKNNNTGGYIFDIEIIKNEGVLI